MNLKYSYKFTILLSFLISLFAESFVCLFVGLLSSLPFFLPFHGIEAQNMSWMITEVSRGYVVHKFRTFGFTFNVVTSHTFSNLKKKCILYIKCYDFQ